MVVFAFSFIGFRWNTTEYVGSKKYFEKRDSPSSAPLVAHGEIKTTININKDVFEASKLRAKRLGLDFGELVEMALTRDIKDRMAILRTEKGVVYAPLLDAPAGADTHPPLSGSGSTPTVSQTMRQADENLDQKEKGTARSAPKPARPAR